MKPIDYDKLKIRIKNQEGRVVDMCMELRKKSDRLVKTMNLFGEIIPAAIRRDIDDLSNFINEITGCED